MISYKGEIKGKIPQNPDFLYVRSSELCLLATGLEYVCGMLKLYHRSFPWENDLLKLKENKNKLVFIRTTLSVRDYPASFVIVSCKDFDKFFKEYSYLNENFAFFLKQPDD